MRKDALLGVCFVMSSALLGGCGGGGGGGGTNALSFVPSSASQSQPTASTSSSTSTQTSTVAVSLQIPATSTSATARRAMYVSQSTKSMTIAVNGGAPTMVNCTTSCSAVVTAPIGNDTFNVDLFDGATGTGNRLSSGSTVATVAAGKANNLALTLSGVPASVAVVLPAANVTPGTSASLPVTVVVKDAAGNTIVGSDPFAAPVTLALTDSTGSVSLSTPTVTSPNTAVTLNYNGSSKFTGATIAPSVSGAATGALAPIHLGVAAVAQATAAPAAPPALANVPAHVQTWLYYGLDGINTSIPASYMAAHADFAESDVDESDRGVAFKAAGGKYSIAYTDPGYVPYCNAVFTAPGAGCTGPIGSLNPDESAWFHGTDGSRIRHYIGGSAGYQEALNPAAPAAQAAYGAWTSRLTGKSPSLDFYFADDSGGVLNGGDFYGFNTPEVEVKDDNAFIAGRQGLFKSANRPLIVNGTDFTNYMPSYNGAFIDAANVAGLNHEGCFTSSDMGLDNDDYNHWLHHANSLLVNVAHQKLAICMPTGATDAATRTFFLASWWMTYEPQYSVAAPVVAAADGYAVFPEFDIVPRNPIATATTDVNVLRHGAAYVREFQSCYQGGRSIGPCAAVVNTTHAAAAMPALTQSYGHTLVLDAKSSYTGGAANWNGGVPSQVAAVSAVILAQ